MEIDNESYAKAEEAEIRDHLCLMNWREVFDGLHLDHEVVFNEEVDAVSVRKGHALVRERNFDLTREAQAS